MDRIEVPFIDNGNIQRLLLNLMDQGLHGMPRNQFERVYKP